jgi:hypothetical protein
MADTIAALICYLVERYPHVGRTQIVKFLYLVDLEARRHLGHPVTDLEYIWHNHGPFDYAILERIRWLKTAGFIAGAYVQYSNGSEGWQFRANPDKTIPLSIPDEEQAIVHYVFEKVMGRSLKNLLNDVYKTRPMLDAKERGAHQKKLRMGLVNNEAVRAGEDLHTIGRAIQEAKAGLVRSFDEIAADLGI